MFKKTILTAVVLISLLTCNAMADLAWYFQNTEIQANGPAGSALGMRSGNTWPVIFSGDQAAVMYPTGWYEITNNTLLEPSTIRAASSSTGEVAAWDSFGSGIVLNQYGPASIQANYMTFDSQGRLWKADLGGISYRDNGAWYSLPSIQNYDANNTSLAVSSSGEVGVITAGEYYHYSSLTGGWTQGWGIGGIPYMPQQPALIFDSHDSPVFVAYDGMNGIACDFNVRTGLWNQTGLPNAQNIQGVLPIATDGNGTIGTAYVSDDGMGNPKLYYAFTGNGSDWTAVEVPTVDILEYQGPTFPSLEGIEPLAGTVGLEYDYEGNPVISYVGEDNNIWLAYDPVIVPEPATLVMLSFGGLALIRRRKFYSTGYSDFIKGIENGR